MRAAKYRRISDDREGRELGVERQDNDLDTLAGRQGLTIVADYMDNDIGASTRSKKPRPQYQQMLKDARAGKFDVILAYTSSRLTRRPRENEDLIDLAKDHGVRFVYVRSPEWDLNTADGREYARMAAARDAGESERIAERVSRAAKQRAERGEYHGGTVPFGFEGIKELVRDRMRVVGLRPHPQHSEWVKEGVERLLSGESLYSVCVDWNAKGRRSGPDARWFSSTLKRAVTTAAIAGYREYDGQLYEAKWDAIVDRDDWQRLRDLLTAPARRSNFNNGNARKYALSGLVFCADCGHVMVSMTASRLRGPSFICSKVATAGGCGSMRISMLNLERFVMTQVFDYVNTPKFRRAVAAARKQSASMSDAERELRRKITEDDATLRRLADEYDDNLMTKAEYRRRRDRLQGRVDANSKQLEQYASRTLVAVPEDLREQWPHRDNAWKRLTLSAIIDRIEISRQPDGMASVLGTPRRGESEADFVRRRDAYTARVLAHRVNVLWV
jgi:site-specific DNA recombinase